MIDLKSKNQVIVIKIYKFQYKIIGMIKEYKFHYFYVNRKCNMINCVALIFIFFTFPSFIHNIK